MNPTDLRYTNEHEWARAESDNACVVGLTEFAAENLGDIVFVELPEIDTEVTQSEKAGEIESVKAVSDLYSPVSGRVIERNEQVVDAPELVNESPYGEGWLLKIEVSDTSQMEKLMTAEQYDAFLENQEG